jgi:ADP-ribosyl-[dinitrogen reductase] hydrolase
MARNLVNSLVARGGFDPDDLIARHLAWLSTGPPDVGTLTRRVLRRVAPGFSAAEAARAEWEERGPEVSAGNGSVMYCAPLGVAFAHRPDELVRLAPVLSALTHYDERCRTAVVAVTIAVASLVRGEGRDEALRLAISAVAGREGGEELEFLVQTVGGVRPIDGPDQGFSLYAAAVGLQALHRGGEFEPELRRVVGLGGDTDTNGAVAGALLGAAAGSAGLPGGWLGKLRDRAEVEGEAMALAALAAER